MTGASAKDSGDGSSDASAAAGDESGPSPPQDAVATFPAVCGPPNGSVSPLVTAPTTQKLVFTGA